MSVVGIGAGAAFTPDVATVTPRAPSGGQAPFGSVVEGLLREANGQQAQVQKQVEGLLTGDSGYVHDVVLSVAKADLAFRLVLEVRNRLIASYQELMRMQV